LKLVVDASVAMAAATTPVGFARVADELGWAKTYDANYIAPARLLDARVVTLDARLRRGAGRTGLVIGPDEV
jgi:hypothetical protein